jgi:hypothetical protein
MSDVRITSPGRRASQRSARVVARRAAAGLLVALLAACGGSGSGDPDRFNAVLFGANQVPPVSSASTALFGFEMKEDDTVVFYRGSIIGLERDEIAGVSVNLGAPGENGPVLFALDGELVDDDTELDVEGVLLASDLEGDSGLATIRDAVQAIRDGRAYVNVTTVANPAGEIRGPIVRGPSTRAGFGNFDF